VDTTKINLTLLALFCFSAGINIPNYDDIRQTIGFKNVSLGNVLNCQSPNEKVFFFSDTDKDLFMKYRGPAFEVQVGLHELLGHGSGKLFSEEPAAVFNFDKSNPPSSPLTQKPITSWYLPGQTWGSVFKGISSSYEECRAETVALHLLTNPKVLAIFGHGATEADDIVYVGFLSMAKAGLSALEFYDPGCKKWGQAHMQARFALLKVFLAAGLAEVKEDNGGLLLSLHRDLISSHGAPAVAKFLTALQVYKATADVIQGTAFYNDATSVDDSWLPFRNIVLRHKQPRKLFVQCNTRLNPDGSISMQKYPATLEGVIHSHVDRNV
jgi:dipeptidyl-peptidase III